MSEVKQPNDSAVAPTGARSEPAEKQDASGTVAGGRDGAARVVACPYCQSQDVEILALFGAQLLTDQYYCNACHTPFEHVRDA